jgi:hypothetical protein
VGGFTQAGDPLSSGRMPDRMLHAGSDPVYERKLRIVRSIVLTLAAFVALSLVTALVFAVYNYTTDRPAKELFQRSGR